ncbi:MAG: hypothetical protein UCH28_01355 [Adlercreutzia sp.]|nr:hypothetical protein [Adlercreutzia sp.]
MNRKLLVRLIALACGAALLAGALTGCLQQNAGVSDSQKANRTYMTQVNQAMEDLNSRLQSFDDAVSRGDAVTMRTQADNAYEAIDALSAIDTPEAMKGLQQNYVDGCTALKEALSAYVDLYTEVESATEEHPFDYGTYDERIKAIQDKYNEGIQKLKDADAEAVKLNDGDGSEAQNSDQK